MESSDATVAFWMADILVRHSASGCCTVSGASSSVTGILRGSSSAKLHLKSYRQTGTHRSKRLPARGSTSEDDVGVVVLVHAEQSL